jgi:hypothetical protein
MRAAKPQTGNYLILPEELILCPDCIPPVCVEDKEGVRILPGYSRCERCGQARRTQLAPPTPAE